MVGPHRRLRGYSGFFKQSLGRFFLGDTGKVTAWRFSRGWLGWIARMAAWANHLASCRRAAWLRGRKRPRCSTQARRRACGYKTASSSRTVYCQRQKRFTWRKPRRAGRRIAESCCPKPGRGSCSLRGTAGRVSRRGINSAIRRPSARRPG